MKLRLPALMIFASLMLVQSAPYFVKAETPAGTAPAKPTYATLASGSGSYTISNLKEEDVVRVDLILSNKNGIVPTLADVALDDRHDQALLALFKVEMESLPGDSKAVPALLIRIKPRTLPQGSYKLRIEIRPLTPAPEKTAVKRPATKSGPSTLAPAQSLTVELKLPAVTLKVPDKFTIHQVRFGLLGENDPPALAVTGLSQSTRLTDVTINQTDVSGSGNIATSRRVEFNPLNEVAPNSTGSSAITLHGDFPLGTTTGAALISAPQLEKPIVLSFEIHNRRARWTIVAVMLLGLVLGFVARIWSKRRIEVREARVKALEAATVLQRELQNRPDGEFHKAVDPSFAALKASIENSTAAQLSNQITVASQALAAALNSLDQRRITVKSQFQTLTELSKKSSQLPLDMRTTVTIDSVSLEKVRGQVALDDVTGATQTLEPLVPELGRSLGAATSAWRINLTSVVDASGELLVFLPLKIATALESDAGELRTKLGEIPLTTEASNLDAISSLFSAIEALDEQINLFIRGLSAQFANTVNSLKVQFPQPLSGSLIQLFDKAEQLAGSLPELVVKPAVGTKDYLERLMALRLNWSKTMVDQIAGSDAALIKKTREQVESALEQDQYIVASIAVIKFLRTETPTDTILGDDAAIPTANEMAAFTEAFSFLDLFGRRRSESGMTTMVTSVHERTVSPSLEALQTRTWRELATARALRFSIAAVIILAVGYALFAEEFVGTFKELMAVFVWAFGLNLSADSMLDSITTTKLS